MKKQAIITNKNFCKDFSKFDSIAKFLGIEVITRTVENYYSTDLSLLNCSPDEIKAMQEEFKKAQGYYS